MASSPPSTGTAIKADRHYPPNARMAAAASRPDRQGTPRREKMRETSAVQDPGLKDYARECLGKGAFGSVYKAFNWGTGEAVAVKQIKLGNLPKSELRMIESEIDLLKNLHHDNIVKYIGFVKSTDCLNIILEYCENGSLHSICKAYGKFPENLVGVYMTQVLQGLQYLHDQGVIHRDIKGANILTTKDGTVKLADFGVSTSTLASGQDKEAQVVGTPYWMAPEIIQLSGASPASDIWSVGCTVIELLQGRPPYHNLAAMPALFAIVNDDHPPLPEGISPAARDFLMQCFQKDPNLRVTARKLLRHAWIVGCRKSEPQVAKTPSNFSQAVEEVKQWNKALQSSDTPLRASIGSDGGLPGPAPPARLKENGVAPVKGGPLSLVKPRQQLTEAFRSPELQDDDNWDDDFATAISPTALQLPRLKPQDNFGGLLSSDRLKAFASIDGASFDEDLDGDLLTIKGPPQQQMMSSFNDSFQDQTIRPVGHILAKYQEDSPEPDDPPKKENIRNRTRSSRPRSPIKHAKLELPQKPELAFREKQVDDYSDLFADDDDAAFNRGLHLAAKRGKHQGDAPQLFHPSDLAEFPKPIQTASVDGGLQRQPSKQTEFPDPPTRRPRLQIEIQRFAENDGEEDFSDIVGLEDSFHKDDASDRGSEITDGRMILSKLSGGSWLGDEEEEDDPFASMDPGWDEMDLEANIARDRHARLCERVEQLVRSLQITETDDVLCDVTEELLIMTCENPEVKNLIISSHGLLPILEILEPCSVKSRQDMILLLLQVVNAIILDDVEIQENLCFVGGIPIISQFVARQYSDEIRLEAAAFVRQMYQTSTLTLQMFVSAGGLNVLVDFLDEDYDSTRDLVLIGVNGIWNVFDMQGPTPKNDFCRIFSRSKILYPLALVLHRVLDEEGEDQVSRLIEGRIVGIFYLFSQAENYVKEVVADRQVLKSVLKDLQRMSPQHQITMLKFIKNLSMLSTTLESLHSADAIEFLIDLLSYSIKRGHKHVREVSNQVLNTMFNLCRLSKERQEVAAVGGIIPLLLRIMKTDRPPKEFVLPILCDMAHSGQKARRYLWQNKGLDFYVSLLADQYWQVTALDAIHVWLQEETANVEGHLMHGDFSGAIISCFDTNRINSFDSNILEPLLKIVRLSPPLALTLAHPEMLSGIVQRLSHKKAVVRLNLLRLVRSIMDSCDPGYLGTGDGITSLNSSQVESLLESVKTHAEKDNAVLVRNLASDLVRSHVDSLVAYETASSSSQPGMNMGGSIGISGNNGVIGINLNGTGAGRGPIRRAESAPRYNSPYTPTSVGSPSSSMPPTPNGGRRHRTSNAGLSRDPFADACASPRRKTVQDRESMSYRPRSREGSIGIPRRVSGELPPSAMTGLSGLSGLAKRLPRAGSVYPRHGSVSNGTGISGNGYSHVQAQAQAQAGYLQRAQLPMFQHSHSQSLSHAHSPSIPNHQLNSSPSSPSLAAMSAASADRFAHVSHRRSESALRAFESAGGLLPGATSKENLAAGLVADRGGSRLRSSTAQSVAHAVENAQNMTQQQLQQQDLAHQHKSSRDGLNSSSGGGGGGMLIKRRSRLSVSENW
ncbi:Cytokinesis protein sepH [Ceratocystis fimbriata CBS 114723]|uniref:non-specific serine/threonine protein kinase n=1 Tax=Ceratocystis fimbriata CBS 114723 TaxID=1035309 RepID=A0A2C5WYX8_9PEZI|nr:Cytokinesis protein sepH [Ceratocystis fimbriata CBS 114723]